MDYDMPVMNGLDATKELTNLMRSGSVPLIPIIGCTAFAFQGELEKGLESGMSASLTKPVQTTQLKSLVDKYLQN
jgi:CheY-like chemotaxis protein